MQQLEDDRNTVIRLYTVELKSPSGSKHYDTFAAPESPNHQLAYRIAAERYDARDVVRVRPRVVDVRLAPMFEVNAEAADLLNEIFEGIYGGVNYLDSLTRASAGGGLGSAYTYFATLVYVAAGYKSKKSVQIPEALYMNWSWGDSRSNPHGHPSARTLEAVLRILKNDIIKNI